MFIRFAQWLDRCLQAAAQKFCDGFQWLTGLTKFRLQKWAIILSLTFVWLTVFTIIHNLGRGNREDLILAVVLVLFVLVYTVAGVLLIRVYDEAEAIFLASGWSMNQHTSSRQRLTATCTWVVVWVLSVFFFGTIWSLVFCFGMSHIAWIYFSACVSRPPGTSKVQE